LQWEGAEVKFLVEPNSGVIYRRYSRALTALLSFPIGEKLEIIPEFKGRYDRFIHDHLKALDLAAEFMSARSYVAMRLRPRPNA